MAKYTKVKLVKYMQRENPRLVSGTVARLITAKKFRMYGLLAIIPVKETNKFFGNTMLPRINFFKLNNRLLLHLNR